MLFILVKMFDGEFTITPHDFQISEYDREDGELVHVGMLEALGLLANSREDIRWAVYRVLDSAGTELPCSQSQVDEFQDSIHALVEAGFISLPTLQHSYAHLKGVQDYLLGRCAISCDCDWRPTETIPEDYYAM